VTNPPTQIKGNVAHAIATANRWGQIEAADGERLCIYLFKVSNSFVLADDLADD